MLKYFQQITNHSLVVGGTTGYRIYSLNDANSLELTYSNEQDELFIVERLSNLVATVAISAPRKLKLFSMKKEVEILSYTYSNSILAVRMNRVRMVVCLEAYLYIYNIDNDMRLVHTIKEMQPNPKGLCVLSTNTDMCLLAYPGSDTIGEVHIFDAKRLHPTIMIPAHDSPVVALAFSSCASKIATASEKGTLIRVFSSTDGQKLVSFRRGISRCVDIACLAFSSCDSFLIVSSNTETVHVFKIEEAIESQEQAGSSWMGYFSSYLPSTVTDVLNQTRAFAVAYIPAYGGKNVVSIMTIQNQLRLVVATQEAELYIFNMDPKVGGQLFLHKEHRIHTSTFSESTEVSIEM